MLNQLYVVARRRRKLILVALVVAIAAGEAIIRTTTPIYESDVQLFVSAQSTNTTVGALENAYQGGLFIQQSVQSFVDLANSPDVLNPVIQSLGLRTTASRLAHDVSATAPTNTVLIDLAVRNHSRHLAQRIARAAALSFIHLIDHLEKPQAGGQSNVRVSVSNPASLPANPVVPNKRLDLVLAVILGLALGLGLALVRERMSSRIEDPDEIEARHGVAVLGSIPEESVPDLKSFGTSLRLSARGEALRQLRTNLKFVSLSDKPRCVAITSPLAGVGKTATLCSLGAVVADTGARVLLLEADLRRPRVASSLGIPSGGAGLTTYLVGSHSLDEALQEVDGVPGLSVILSGPLPPNPAELVASTRMEQLLFELRERFDLVLIDLPPLLPVTDAVLVAARADGTVLVVRHGQTTHRQLEASIASLARVDAKVYGAVVNAVPRKHAPYSYSYEQTRPLWLQNARSQAAEGNELAQSLPSERPE